MTWMGPPPEYVEPVPESERGPVDNSVGWLLAVAPLLILLIDAALLLGGLVGAYTWGVWIGLAVNVALAATDSKLLQKRGYPVSTGLAVFLVPVYLVQRARTTKQTYAMPAVWVAVFVASLTGSFALERALGVVQLDMPGVEASVEDWLNRMVPGTSASVSCPAEDAYQVGASFYCSVGEIPGITQMAVTVQDVDGSITWQAVG
jgi:hypothetical protein